ncbi:hypothetical protein [Archangium violaceum]|uniref:Uncharacterized protein n=1 Tax=Archangium violaceum Cb vi76 TaxID=1406225 RepID=A0A084T1C4_9BACT|nr:hypothetical protein [Archangium violaceum]KFA94509.1 hypothetical protein Q664_02450 [Archangium violaceum Cb vi76]
MNPRELRRELRQRQKELRRSVEHMKRAARERVEQLPSVQREKRRRRVRRAVTLAALLLLAMLVRCECQPPPAPPPEPVVKPAPAEVKPKKPEPPASKPKALSERMKRQRRGSYQNEAQTSPSWLDDFRLQVAARSPRLAQCFSGTERPGALRWTAAVNAASGSVSDHALELVGMGGELSGKQRDCVQGVLSSPGYRLKPEQQQDLPGRVSIVIEF